MRSMLPDWLSSWEKRQAKPIPPEFGERVLSLSASTLDRILSPFRVKFRKPVPESSVAALKAAIPYVEPILLVPEPGYLFVDIVAHCGGDMSGDFVWTLMVAQRLLATCEHLHEKCVAARREIYLITEAP